MNGKTDETLDQFDRQAAEDLENLKESLNYPTLIIDEQKTIRVCNREAKRVFQLGDEARDIGKISILFDIAGLPQRVSQAMEQNRTQQQTVYIRRTSFLERITPSKASNGECNGAILSFMPTQLDQEQDDQELRYELALHGASMGLWDWNIVNDSLYCSGRLFDLLRSERTRTKPQARFLWDRVHPEDRDDVNAILTAHLRNGFDFNVECRLLQGELVNHDREESALRYIWVHARGQAVWNPERRAIRMSGTIDDCSDRRAILDSLRSSNLILGRFAKHCSQGLTPPARQANNFASLLKKSSKISLDANAGDYVDNIVESTTRLQDLITDIQTYTSLDTSDTGLELVSCNAELDRVVAQYAHQLRDSGVTFSRSELPVIKANKEQLAELFQQAMARAVATEKNYAMQISVRCEERSEEWQFTFHSGSEDTLATDRLTERRGIEKINEIEQAEDGGVGLSICQKIVHNHGGQIWLSSEDKIGRSLIFRIPKNPLWRLPSGTSASSGI